MAKVTLYLIRETPAARLYNIEPEGIGNDVWLPKSQIQSQIKEPMNAHGTNKCVVEIPDWLCEQEGLEDES